LYNDVGKVLGNTGLEEREDDEWTTKFWIDKTEEMKMDLHKYLYWFKAYALRHVRRDVRKAVRPEWEVTDISWFVAHRVNHDLWELYIEVHLATDWLEWSNGTFVYNAKTGKLQGKFIGEEGYWGNLQPKSKSIRI
jgi:hypothetical protein